MPFGVTRFKNVAASWVSAVGTNGRLAFTAPMSAVPHAVGLADPLSDPVTAVLG